MAAVAQGFAFLVAEAGIDLNGDGDWGDDVVHFYDPVAGVTNLAVAGNWLVEGSAVLAIGVPEGAQGSTDLNGDGDTNDDVVHAYDPASGVTNLGLVATTAGLDPMSDGFGFMVSEGGQGFTDLNGDGDSVTDFVIHVYERATGVTNLGLALFPMGIYGLPSVRSGDQWVAFAVGEEHHGGTDLNGDGDTTDTVVHVYESGTGVTNLGVAGGSGAIPLVPFEDGFAFMAVDEDFNNIVHVYDLADGITNLGLVADDWLTAGAEGLAFTVSEWVDDVDLNGDGDASDDVVQVVVPDIYPVAEDDDFFVSNGGVLEEVAPGLLGNDFDPDGDPLTAAWYTDPAHGTLTVFVDGSFIYTHDGSAAATDSFTYWATDGEWLSNPATVSITINDPPIAVDDGPYVVDVGGTLVELAPGLLANDSDPDGDAVEGAFYTDPAHGTLTVFVDGSFLYTHDGSDATGDSFTYWATDGIWLSNEATVTITVNQPPMAVDDGPYVADEDATLVVNGVLDNDIDPNGDVLAAIKLSDPAHGTLTLSADGSFTYQPDADFNGADSFTYRASDGALESNVATVAITISPVNDPPIAQADGFSSDEDTELAVPAPGVLGNDSDIDGNPLTAVLVDDVRHGTLTLSTDGSFTYQPDADFSGADSFTYRASDGSTTSSDVTVSISVDPVDDVGTSESSTGEVEAGATVTTDEARDGATAADPLETSVTSPVGGAVMIEEVPATEPDPSGFQLLGVQVNVTAPAATAAAPLHLVFRLDASITPAGESATTIELFKDGALVAACAGSGSASPDPCIASRKTLSDGDVEITVLTSTASLWSFGTPAPAVVLPTVLEPTSVGLVDPSQGKWYLRDYDTGAINSFFYGNPGDIPFMGDWDCDGEATPGLFRQADAYAYLRNSNTVGIADIRFYFGNPDDVPLAGDFSGDGCDTLSIYRPAQQRFYIMNELGENEGGLGAAEYFFTFGNPGDKPVVGDWDGDGIDEIGLHRESTGFFYYRNSLDVGIADDQFYFGDPGDRFAAGDWGTIDGVETPAVFRPSNTTFYFRWTNTPGAADSEFVWGESGWLPVSGVLD